jgi:tRNA(fMet)-specific endonuclease VapC
MVDPLLDTNCAIALLKRNPDVIKALMGREFHFSTIVLGELYYGAFNSARVKDNIQDSEILVSGHTIHICDGETAYYYGQIKAQLRRIGRPIPDNDIWISACAMQHDLEVVTRDGHFKHVHGLKTSTW